MRVGTGLYQGVSSPCPVFQGSEVVWGRKGERTRRGPRYSVIVRLILGSFSIFVFPLLNNFGDDKNSQFLPKELDGTSVLLSSVFVVWGKRLVGSQCLNEDNPFLEESSSLIRPGETSRPPQTSFSPTGSVTWFVRCPSSEPSTFGSLVRGPISLVLRSRDLT